MRLAAGFVRIPASGSSCRDRRRSHGVDRRDSRHQTRRRQEIIDAVRRIILEGIDPDQVDDALLSQHLYTAGQPDPDLIIRTSGEMRVSNFLIWQGAYAELYVTPTYWPDFNDDELQKALDHYAARERRFGLTAEQMKAAAQKPK